MALKQHGRRVLEEPPAVRAREWRRRGDVEDLEARARRRERKLVCLCNVLRVDAAVEPVDGKQARLSGKQRDMRNDTAASPARAASRQASSALSFVSSYTSRGRGARSSVTQTASPCSGSIASP
jgi:hypothetical protein